MKLVKWEIVNTEIILGRWMMVSINQKSCSCLEVDITVVKLISNACKLKLLGTHSQYICYCIHANSRLIWIPILYIIFVEEYVFAYPHRNSSHSQIHAYIYTHKSTTAKIIFLVKEYKLMYFGWIFFFFCAQCFVRLIFLLLLSTLCCNDFFLITKVKTNHDDRVV